MNREAFEAWVTKFRSNVILRRFENGEYVSAVTENYFNVWQAALAQANVNEQSQAQQNHIEDALNMVQSQAQQSQWISVEERLPKAHTTVLVVTNFDCIYTCRLPVIVAKNSALDLENGIRERFTHWMPLPLPPAPEGGQHEH